MFPVPLLEFRVRESWALAIVACAARGLVSPHGGTHRDDAKSSSSSAERRALLGKWGLASPGKLGKWTTAEVELHGKLGMLGKWATGKAELHCQLCKLDQLDELGKLGRWATGKAELHNKLSKLGGLGKLSDGES